MYFDVELGFFGTLMVAIFIIALIVVSRPRHYSSVPSEAEAKRREEENAKLNEHIDRVLSEHEAEVKRILGE